MHIRGTNAGTARIKLVCIALPMLGLPFQEEGREIKIYSLLSFENKACIVEAPGEVVVLPSVFAFCTPRNVKGQMSTASVALLRYKQRAYCSFSGDEKQYQPAPWIFGDLAPQHANHIWYWMREGPYEVPSSCMEVQRREFLIKPLKGDGYSRFDTELYAS